MAKIDVTKTELVWPGKYDENGQRKEVDRVNLPFQVIETINESRATREALRKPLQKGLFDVWDSKEGDTFEEGWRNKLIWGDNKYVMSSLLEKFAGKIDLIYIDPPFATGADFTFKTQIGENSIPLKKEQSIIEEKAYRDTWGKGLSSYLSMIYERLTLMKELLHDNGTIYVHLDWHVASFVRLIMTEIFGDNNFVNEVIWCYKEREMPINQWNPKHDNIYMFSKKPKAHRFFYERVLEEYSEITKAKFKYQDEKGWYQIRGKAIEASPVDRADGLTPEHEEKYPGMTYRQYMKRGSPPRDWWQISIINKAANERTYYGTQKPEAVLKKIIEASTDKGDLVADFFSGSGTTCAVSERLGRRWIGCDLSRWGVHVTRKRLLEIENCKPFEVLNLGKYERKYWQGVTFRDKKGDEQMAIFQYLAFILKLYDAEPLAGMEHLHGKKGKAVIHVGAVDAPVTIDEINSCIDECEAIRQKELHILGWEWEMGLYELMPDVAKGRGIKLLLFNIPREVMEEQAVNKGDIQFFELAHLEVAIKHFKKRYQGLESGVIVTLKNFSIPNTELISDDVRTKIKKWSDYIDYWAVDWNFQNDTFMNGWVAYRTRKDRTLQLETDPYQYEESGRYTIMVKVVDIFGNDTTQAFQFEVK